jgi:hypothetical protein
MASFTKCLSLTKEKLRVFPNLKDDLITDIETWIADVMKLQVSQPLLIVYE